MAVVILFDVNETLLEMSALDPFFERLFGAGSMRERWFKELEALWLVTVATGEYQDFPTLAEAALQMTAEKDEIELSLADRAELLERMSTLPPHPDVVPALAKLRRAGLRLAALTNGTLKSARTQLRHAELQNDLKEIFSADEVQRYKPAPEPYLMAAERLGVEPNRIRLVAAHAWDIAGAQSAGLQTAFVARPRKVLNPVGPKPGLQADDLLQLVEMILSEDT